MKETIVYCILQFYSVCWLTELYQRLEIKSGSTRFTLMWLLGFSHLFGRDETRMSNPGMLLVRFQMGGFLLYLNYKSNYFCVNTVMLYGRFNYLWVLCFSQMKLFIVMKLWVYYWQDFINIVRLLLAAVSINAVVTVNSQKFGPP